MNTAERFILKACRKVYSKLGNSYLVSGRNWKMFSQKEYANDLIASYLNRNAPCMITRFGSTEMLVLLNHLGIKQSNRSYKAFIQGKTLPWWWEPSTIDQIQRLSGFFPATPEEVQKFAVFMTGLLPKIDILGSWLNQEIYFEQELSLSKKVVLEDLEPFFTNNPWTKALAKKKVLVVHPFASLIESQYKKKDLLFENNLLPDFELITIKAVQSIASEKTAYANWFEALDSMKNQIDKADFDIAIIGCGAYGLPLAAHVKSIGKKAIHLGGVTQLLFGIKGRRWEQYIVWPYANLFNEHWVRAGEKDKPQNALLVEGACYW